MSTLTKIRNFLKALWFHIGAGLPKSTQDQIDKRFDVCQKCEMFDNRSSQCLVCGCNLSRKKVFLNKLAWSDQKCPLNKW